MSYIDKSLAPGEQLLARGKWPVIFWVGAWAALIFLGIILVGIFLFLRSAIEMSTTQFAVTDRRVVLKRGWLNRHTQELAVESVEGVHLDQTIWQRLFGYGRIIVTGTGDARIVFPPMSDPVTFRRAIETARAHSKEVHIAPGETVATVPEPVEPGNVEEPRERRPRRRGGSFIGMRAD
jgi:uncharacterized membrane protein YdbT with pleckstrin-like domain